jgi:phage baseplate assembly protein W
MTTKYRDLTLSFRPNPITGDLSTVSNEKSINQSIKNLVFYNFYDIPFEPRIGSNLRAKLFDLLTPMLADSIKQDIKEVIENYEPRVDLIDVRVVANDSKNGIDVTIVYTAKTSTEEITLNYFLSRVI